MLIARARSESTCGSILKALDIMDAAEAVDAVRGILGIQKDRSFVVT